MATTSAAAAATTSAAATITLPSSLKTVGIILAIASGCLIGSSFVFKKKGLVSSQKAGGELGEGVGYLKSPLWWTGMIMMILGELCNFAAYAFVEALVVTPLGALSVVISAILSSIFLKETLTFFGWVGCALCIIGSVIIALNGPQEPTIGQITQFEDLFIAPGFLSFAGVLIAVSLSIMFYFGPRYGKKSMLWYIFVCSMIGGISVSVTTGLGAAIVTTAMGDNQFNHWFIYFLIVFVIVTLLTEVFYLNKALAMFNTAMVTPTYYVIFTFFSMVTTVILFQGLSASAAQIITIVMAFLVICCGITILQMSKVDPTELKGLDRKSTILLQAARQNTEKVEHDDITGIEDPGMDAIRGTFGGLGSLIRARSARKMSISTRSNSMSTVRASRGHGSELSGGDFRDGLQRHQLYDAPMPGTYGMDMNAMKGTPPRGSSASQPPPRTPTIKFGAQDVVHKYSPAGAGMPMESHEQRAAWGSPQRPSHFSSPPGSPRSILHGLPVVEEGAEMQPMHSILAPPPRASTPARNAIAAPPLRIATPVEVHDPFGPSGDNPFSPINNPFTSAMDPYERTSSILTTRGGTSHIEHPPMPQHEEADFDAAWRAGRRQARPRTASGRHYPGESRGGDDGEESMSLVNPTGDEDASDENEEDEDIKEVLRRMGGGIRLVTPSPQNSVDHGPLPL